MTIRFFILQTHYRSTLDFGNEALQAAEKGLKRLWDAYEILLNLPLPDTQEGTDTALTTKIATMLDQLDEFMNDDFNTAKVLANLFEIVPIINSISHKHIEAGMVGARTIGLMQNQFRTYIENILGLHQEQAQDNDKLSGTLELLIELRKEARAKKDYATSDKIRNQLQDLGISLKDDKDGNITYSM